MVKSNNRGESNAHVVFTSIIAERKEVTALPPHAPIAIIDRLAAGLSRFLVQAYRPSLGGATRKRTALPPHAPPLKPIWRQAS